VRQASGPALPRRAAPRHPSLIGYASTGTAETVRSIVNWPITRVPS
jgi:hypothetical protein